MAKKAPSKAAAKAEAPKVDIANINRTSDVAQADYVNTLLKWGDREELADLVESGTINAIEDAIEEAGDLFQSSTEKAIERAIATKVDAALRALSNDAELTGYAGRAFDAEVFAKRVQPKAGRTRLSPAEKAERVVEGATDEQLSALAELLKARGIEI